MFLHKPKRLYPAGLFFTLILVLASCSQPVIQPRPASWAQPVAAKHLHNFYRVDRNIYRSAQPDAVGMQELESKGIKTVLDLRAWHSDRPLMQGTRLKYLHLPMLAHNISLEQLDSAVELLRQAEKPVLVHCQHGADRTGAVIAAWRIAVQGWSNDAAVSEMLYGGYGHHAWLFPDIRVLLSTYRQPPSHNRHLDGQTNPIIKEKRVAITTR